MNTFTKREVLAYAAELLREWGDGKLPPKPQHGICENLYDCLDLCGYQLVADISRFWHRFSGDCLCPVPSIFCGFAWGDNEEGDNRRDLCHMIAGEIEDYLETGEC